MSVFAQHPRCAAPERAVVLPRRVLLPLVVVAVFVCVGGGHGGRYPPSMLDHVLVSPGLFAGLGPGSVVVRHDLAGVSDHVPLVVTFDLDRVQAARRAARLGTDL